MFHLRRAAVRLITAPSSTSITRSRTITSFSSVSRIAPKPALPSRWQQRWASSEAEAKRDNPTPAEEVPVSQIQPTSQEEVENAIHQDNAASAQAEAEPAERPSSASAGESQPVPEVAEATEDHAPQASSSVQSAVQSTRPPRDVGSSRSSVDGSAKGSAEPKESVYIGNLFFDVTENDLQKEFARFGEVKSCRLIRDGRGLSKGFGYIQFGSVDAATNAINDMNQQLFEGRRLMVAFAHNASPIKGPREPRSDRALNEPSKTLFIGNMSFEMTDKDLNTLFRGIRNVIDVRVAIDRRTGQPRGFAHADFVDVKSAQEAFKVLQDKETYGRKLRVDYSYGPSTAPRNTPQPS